MGSPFKTFKMASSNLPPELIEIINKPSIAHVSETSHWLTRHQNVRSSKNLESQSIDWLTTNQIGDPSKTAWMINEKGNKVWFTYEHTPSIFPVKETRFYKPRLHKKDFMHPDEDEENEKSI